MIPMAEWVTRTGAWSQSTFTSVKTLTGKQYVSEVHTSVCGERDRAVLGLEYVRVMVDWIAVG